MFHVGSGGDVPRGIDSGTGTDSDSDSDSGIDSGIGTRTSALAR